jgi:hypothetical protein
VFRSAAASAFDGALRSACDLYISPTLQSRE